MITALLKSINQMFSRELLGIFMAVIALTLASLVGLWFAAAGLLESAVISGWSWLDTAIKAGAALVGLVLTYVLFVPVAMLFAGLFQDKVADAVERVHYPGLPPARGLPVASAVWAAVRLLIWSLVLNLLVLPLYLIPVVNLGVFVALNGYLLAREYYEIIAFRRLDRKAASAFRHRHRIWFWLAGMIVAFGFMVPVVNLMTPIVGTAFMVHIFERARRSDPAFAAESV